MAIIYFFIYLLFCIFFICKGVEELKLEYGKELFKNKNALSTNNNENEDNKNNEDENNNNKDDNYNDGDNNNIENNKKHRKSKTKKYKKSKSVFYKSEYKKKSSKNLKKQATKILPKNSAFNLEVITENLKSVIPCKNNSINLSENDAPPKKKSSLKKDLFTKIAKKTKINQDNARSHKIEKIYSEKKVLTATDLFSRIETNNEMITSEKNIRKKSSDDDSENQEEQKIILDNYELNELEYEEAVKLDKRNCCQIYWSLLIREHIIFFTFCNKDHNIFFIKFIRLIFLICGDMAYNVFFFQMKPCIKLI